MSAAGSMHMFVGWGNVDVCRVKVCVGGIDR